MPRLARAVAVLLTACFVTLLAVDQAEGCSCMYTHPQTHFCSSDFVIVIKVKERIPMGQDTAYKVKINRKFKLSNESFNDYLYDGLLYAPSMDSMCSVHLQVGETYVVAGRIYEGRPRLSLCNLTMRWSEVSKRQRKGFKGLYAKGCVCDVSYTSFARKGEALHRANGTLCPWEGNPGPMDCQEKHGICVSNQGRCFWMPSRPYDLCIKEHYQNRMAAAHPRQREPLMP
ncbi:hypothetical protein TSAR_005955 [Trichomalopsis sarcophagae]|uniref:NTR domain-containing protein n=1 Tax=Trichomalopsis sarcophagae TaxID=543379 RepID=A0A232EP03_9HYME|nr:hypothetical protein TSAR_005955 [Trichomalopsis sarcophagae]